MKAPNTQCFRCGKEIDTPNSSNADYVIADDAIDDGVQKTAIICPDCYTDTDKVIWGVHSNEASEEARHQFNAYMARMYHFQGQMNAMANSIDLMLNVILEEEGVKLPKMLGGKISEFGKRKAVLADKYTGDFDELIKKLRKFNENWVIAKHGMIVGGLEDLTIRKDDKLHTFVPKRQEEIGQEFTENMKALIEISKGI